MKNTIRVRHNGGKTSSSAQPQKRLLPKLHRALIKQVEIEGIRLKKEWDERIKKEFTAPETGAAPCCIALYDRENREIISRVPLTEQEFLEVWESGRPNDLKRNEAERFICRAIREKLSRLKLKSDIESAMWQANSFMQVLIEKLEEIATGPNEFRGEHADRFLAGLQGIKHSISSQLEKAVYDEITAGKPTAEALPG